MHPNPAPPIALPIDPLLPEIVEAVRATGAVVIEAPPGAGKTTRVPRALLKSGLAGAGELLVLEPRRLAVRMAARRVASELGTPVGGTVGYQVRYENLSGPGTRLKFVTEGVMIRKLADEPSLPGVGAVVLDEFHERHLHGDLSLALLRRLKETTRPDLKIVVMSATLEAAPVAAWLKAPIVRSEGRRYEVAVEYLPPAEASDPRFRVEEQVARAIRRLIREGTKGHILVFLPGMGEIRRSMTACGGFALQAGYELLPLHSDLSPEEQDRAVLPGLGLRIIFATNVAETSVTIDGVVAVVDTGLARVASHSPWSGLPRLDLRKISRASAAQRAGRAGRTGPGRAIRLYTAFDHDMRPAFDLPEIARGDLTESVLLMASMGVSDLAWLDSPPAAALDAARSLLARLGALDVCGNATETGRRMIRFPLHPRLSRLVIEAHARGAGREGALIAALVSEGDIRRHEQAGIRAAHSPNGNSDLLELAHIFDEAELARFAPARLNSLGLDGAVVSRVSRARRQIAALLPGTDERTPRREADNQEEGILAATLAAFSDRLGRRREAGGDEVVLASGGSARLASESVVRSAPLLVAVDVEEKRAIRLASAVTPELLLELFPDRLQWEEIVTWNEGAERVEGWEKLTFDGLVLESSRKSSVDPVKASALLAVAARAKGARAFGGEGAIDRLQDRLSFVSATFPDSGVNPFTEEAIADALERLCRGLRSFADLREAGISDALASLLAPDRRAFLDRMAPERIALPGGRSVKVEYGGNGMTPHIESRLQEFFGAKAGPAVGGGRVPLVIQLLAPSMRPVQVTADLAGFWERHYPALRKELMRRYPKHAWPENPLDASPPRRRA